MDLWLRVALAILATWRVTHLLAHEDGPGAVLVRLRERLGVSWAGNMLDCVYCLSLAVAAPLAAFVTVDLLEWLVSWFAISGAACLLERIAPDPIVIRPLPETDQGDIDDALLWPGAVRRADHHHGGAGTATGTPCDQRQRSDGI